MSDNSERSGPSRADSRRDASGPQEAPRRGVREWLADLFSDEPENIPELIEILRQAAERRMIDDEALNIIFGALHVGDGRGRTHGARGWWWWCVVRWRYSVPRGVGNV